MNRSLLAVKLFAISLFILLSAPLRAQQNDVESRAMRDEMQRSMKQLHLDSADSPQPPYYIAYKITDTDRKEAQAAFGSLTSSGETRSRVLSVTVRVGSYDVDNSNRAGVGDIMALLAALGSGTNILPIDDNYDELRRKIWLATDSAYKKAVEDLSAKKAAQQNKNRNETISDFSVEPARQESEILPPVNEKLTDAEHLVKAVSGVFRTLPSVQTSSTQFEISNTTERFLNSEGTTYTRQVPELDFHAKASVQNSTGEIFNDSYSAYGRSLSDLPTDAALVHEAQVVSDRLSARIKGHATKHYNGPVLFLGQSSAELFARYFANLLAAHARASSDSGNPFLSSLISGSTASLLEKMGSRVLPDFLTVVDNPQLTQSDGHPLFGNYKFDEEGTPSQETVIVKDGILKRLLTSRTPARGMPQSTGNMRERGVLPGNLFMDASKTASSDELKAQLLDLVKARDLEYGIIIRRLAGNTAVEASRVYPDGHEEVLRNARVTEVTAASFKDIIAVSKERTVFTDRAAVTSFLNLSPAGGGDLITYVVPAMLFEDMTVEHVPNDSPKLPATPTPFASE